jgi:hypothetical protein
VTEVVEDFTTPMAPTAPRIRRQRLILTTDIHHGSADLVERPEDRMHDDIAGAGNALRDELEVEGAQFIEAA